MDLRVVWSLELCEPYVEPLLLVGDVLLVSTQESGQPAQRATLRALNCADGRTRWQRVFENALVSGLGTGQVGQTWLVLAAIYSADVLHGEGALLALNLAGEQRWRWPPAGQYVQRVSAPAVAGDRAYITADARLWVALDISSGAECARVELPESASLAAPAWTSGVVYIPCRSPHLLALDADGKPVWQLTLKDAPEAWLDKTPIVVNETVYAVSSTGAVVAVQARDGTLAWQADLSAPRDGRAAGKPWATYPLSPPAADGERLYVGARDGLYALDLRTGREAWTFHAERRIEAAPVATGGAVYCAGHDHRVYALDAATGRELWRHEMARRIEVSPAVTEPAHLLGACVLAADRGGALRAIRRPLSAAEHEAAGHWVEAASAYVELGRPARSAELLEAHGEPFKAAELWKQAGELERAAAQYEAAGAWPQAAEIWETLAQPLKQAEALERHARSSQASGRGDEECAAIWDSAARAFDAAGEVERGLACQCEVARLCHLPFIQVRVEASDVMLLAEYHEIAFELTNVGGGMARQVILRHTTSEFAGDLQTSRQLRNVAPGKSVSEALSLRALAAGPRVPLDVSVTFTDLAGRPYEVRHRAWLCVRRPGAPVIAKRSGVFNDFEIRVFPREAKGYPVEMTLGGEQVSRRGYMGEILPWAFSGDPAQDGQRLLETLLADTSLRRAWDRARGQSPRCRIRLWLDAGAPELHAIPWELLQEDQVVLSASADTPFSRYLPVWKSWGNLVEARPIRVLAAISNPRDLQTKYDLPPADVKLEKETLEAALGSVGKDRLDWHFLPEPVTLERLEEAIREGYHIVHFLGHGVFSTKKQQAALYLQDEDGAARRTLDDELAGMLARQGVQPRLVFLTACQSAARSTVDAFLGLGPKLVSIGVPAVVAMQDIVSFTTARKLGARFYQRLLEHGLVDLAMNEARGTLLTAGRTDAAAPVLFMRLKSGQLWAEEEVEAH